MSARKKLKLAKPNIIKMLYQLMYDVKRIFEAYKIKYWAVGGTFLGAIRHNGIIPWDDDLDIGIMNSDRHKILSLRRNLSSCGYKIVKTWFGYKVVFKNRKNISGENYSFPSLDLFTYKLVDNEYIPAIKQVRNTWPKEIYKRSQIDSLVKHDFGAFKMFVPSDYKIYFDKLYGKDWNEIAYREYDHAKEEEVKKVKVKLTKKDRTPAEPYDEIKDRSCITKLCVLKSKSSNSQKYISKLMKTCSSKGDQACRQNFDLNIGTYVINCDVHKDRMKKFIKYAKKADLAFCRESCTKGNEFSPNVICDMRKRGILHDKAGMTPIEVAINLSHYNVWTRMLNNCDDYALIMEDDCEVDKDFVDRVNNIMNSLNKKFSPTSGKKIREDEMSVLFLWNGNWMDTQEDLEKVTTIDGISIYQEMTGYNAGAVAYIISKKFAQYLVDRMLPIKEPQDMWIGSKWRVGMHLTLKCKFNKKRDCYVSPLLDMECGGEAGTGNSTQLYDSINVSKFSCYTCKK